ncbi:hypothetical protein [Burkholderia lata]|uniref:hypothetical protein n=1 Tax=Burkholderia lata (strain ATCC 17760 / DSM 23089 / LMG 22485 / NCIMB 9086 / R18194 / 383) TaxID=482957 RepID=UPI00399AFAC3
MTTNMNRAVALTDENIEDMAIAHGLYGARKAVVQCVRDLLAASPVEQQEAAPADDEIMQMAADEGFAIRGTKHGQWVLAGSEPVAGFLRIVRAVAARVSIARPEPQVAHERAAFVKFWREVDEMDPEETARAAFTSGAAFARASSPNAKGTEDGALYIHVASTPDAS